VHLVADTAHNRSFACCLSTIYLSVFVMECGEHRAGETIIHRSAWKENSQKLVCRMPHSPARLPPYGRPESSRLLKVDHSMLHLRIMMRSGGCAASSQNTDTDTGCGG
jgi:hypothetical protein